MGFENYGSRIDTEKKTKKIIIDTDVALGQFGCDVDDGLAIVMALNSPELEIMGITKTYGNTTLPKVNTSLEKLLNAWEKSTGRKISFPNYSGADRPIHKFPKKSFQVLNKNKPQKARFDSFLQNVRNGTIFPAVKFIADMIIKYPKEIILVPIGPLTNIALLFSIFPEVVEDIKMLSIMGGSIYINRGYEFNFANDPIATNIVLSANVKTEICGLEVCEAQQFNLKHYKRLIENRTNLSNYLSETIRSWLYLNRARHMNKKDSGFYPFDPCAIFNLVKPHLVKKIKLPVNHTIPNYFSIKRQELRTSIIREKYDERKNNSNSNKSTWVDWALKIDSKDFMNLLLERLK